jgi:hypothetical protein
MYFDKSRKKKEVTGCSPVVFLQKNFLGNRNGTSFSTFIETISSFFFLKKRRKEKKRKSVYHSIAIKRKKKHECTQNLKTGIGPIFF